MTTLFNILSTPDWRRISRGPVASAAISTLVLRLINVLLGLVTTVILGRTLGAAGFGVFAIGLAAAMLVSGVVQLGFSSKVIAKTAEILHQQAWAQLNGIRLFCMVITLLTAGAITVIVLALAALLPDIAASASSRAFLIGLVVAPVIIADRFASALLRGFNKTFCAYFPQFVVMHGVQLSIILFLAVSNRLTPETALFAFGFGNLISLLASLIWTLHHWPTDARGAKPEMAFFDWTHSAVFIMIGGVAVMLVGRIETFALAHFATAAEIGVYALAFRFAQFVTFPAFALASGLAPTIARQIAANNVATAQLRGREATRVAAVLSLLGALALFMGAHWFFPFINPEFATAAPVLLIISIGYVIAAASGFPELFIVALRLERFLPWPGLLLAVLSIIMTLSLSALFGALGAAVASAATFSAAALLRWRIIYSKMQLRCDVFAPALTHSQGASTDAG